MQKKQKGQGLVEYALITALVAVVAIGALTTIGQRMSTTFTNIAGQVGNT